MAPLPSTALGEAAVAAARVTGVMQEASALSLFDKVAAIQACKVNPFQAPVLWHPSIFGSMMQLDLRETVSQQIFLTGAFEPDLLWFMSCVVDPGMTAIDAGAHIGFFSIALGRLVGPGGRVDAFEPVQPTKLYLDTNIRNTGMTHVYSHGLAVWSEARSLAMNVLGPEYNAYNSVSKPRLLPGSMVKPAEVVHVPAVSLDGFVASAKTRPSFVKIDVESAEHDVLRGMRGVLADCRPIVVLEIGDIEGTGARPSHQTLRLLADAGYALFDVKNCRLTPFVLEERPYEYANVVGLPMERAREIACRAGMRMAEVDPAVTVTIPADPPSRELAKPATATAEKSELASASNARRSKSREKGSGPS